MPEVSHRPTLAAAAVTLDVLAAPALLLDQGRRILYKNAATRSLFDAARIDEGLLRVGGDYPADFRAAFPDTGDPRAELEQWLRAALEGASGAVKSIYDSGASERPYIFELQIASYPLDGASAALVLLRDITEERRTLRALQDSERRFRLLTDISSDAVLISDRGVIIEANSAFCAMFGYSHDEIIGKSVLELTAPEFRETVRANVASGYEAPYEMLCLHKDGSRFPASGCGRMLPFQGRLVRCTTMRDLTPIKQTEEMMRRSIAQEEKIRAQAEMLAELSTPLIPLSDEIIVIPVIGSVDPQRAQRVLDTLLEGISRSRAKIAILDITGVAGVDADVANSLIQAARAVRLLGAQLVLSGIRPEVAQTLVRLGSDLSGIITHGTLQNGIAYAMTRRR